MRGYVQICPRGEGALTTHFVELFGRVKTIAHKKGQTNLTSFVTLLTLTFFILPLILFPLEQSLFLRL